MRALLLSTTLALLAACGPKPELVHVMARSATGLKPGARVQYRGIEVGQVRAIYFTTDGVQIDLEIFRRDAPIRAQDKVRLITVGGFGEQVVEIEPGPDTAPLITPGGSLPAATSTSAIPTREEVMRVLSSTMERLVGPDTAKVKPAPAPNTTTPAPKTVPAP